MAPMTVMLMMFVLMTVMLVTLMPNLRQDVTLLQATKAVQNSTAEKDADGDDDASDIAALEEMFGKRNTIDAGIRIPVNRDLSKACPDCIAEGKKWQGNQCVGNCQIGNVDDKTCYDNEAGCKLYEEQRLATDYLCAPSRSCNACLATHELCMWDSKQEQCYSQSYLNTREFDDVDIIAKDHGHCLDTKGCLRDTGGSCTMMGCKADRNAKCVEGKCVCAATDCSRFGKCFERNNCPVSTGGKCDPFLCDVSRKAHCVDGGCVCKKGSCSFMGRCWGKNALDQHSVYFSTHKDATHGAAESDLHK